MRMWIWDSGAFISGIIVTICLVGMGYVLGYSTSKRDKNADK